jgi:hypothetical protein
MGKVEKSRYVIYERPLRKISLFRNTKKKFLAGKTCFANEGGAPYFITKQMTQKQEKTTNSTLKRALIVIKDKNRADLYKLSPSIFPIRLKFCRLLV